MNPKPEKKVVRVECSLCGEEWDAHGDKPSTLDCIRLLKAKVPAEKVTYIPTYIPQPYPIQPQPWWQRTWYSSGLQGSLSQSGSGGTTYNSTSTVYRTPENGDMN